MLSKFLRPLYSVFAVVLTLMTVPSFASTVTYTDSATFLASLAPGYYTENFDGLSNPAPTAFTGGAFSYTVSSPGGLYASGEVLGTNLPYQTLRIDFSGDVHAVGGNFYATNISDFFEAGELNISLSNGTSLSFIPTSESIDSYLGFTSDEAITWLTLTVTNVDFNSFYANLDNLTVGAMAKTVDNNVPEPASMVLVGLGLAGLLVSRRQRAN